MHSKIVLLLITTFFGVFVTANYPVTTSTTITVTAPAPTVTTASQCNTGEIACCNELESASSDVVTDLLGLLGIVLSDVTALVGIGCVGIEGVGVGGGTCSAQAVCCTDNILSGLINLGCNAITL